VAETPDPLGGSYFVESLTDELEAAAWAYLAEIDAAGGTLAALGHGFQQREIQEAAYRSQVRIERGDQVVVGVNRFIDDGGGSATAPALQGIDPEAERLQVEGVQRVRRERDEGACRRSLDRVADAARGRENLLPPLLEAVSAYATLGEISDGLRLAWGELRELITV
jgi:methylmalonyl-CoA mutase N-terminal domain/subunit